MLHQFKTLEGLEIQARDGNLGKVADVYFDDETWVVRYLVVKTGGWFSGKEVLLSAPSLARADAEGGRVMVDLTTEQIRHAPDVDARKPISRVQEETLGRYYGWTPYWGVGFTQALGSVPLASAIAPSADALRNTGPAEQPLPSSVEHEVEAANRRRTENIEATHLRSASEVRGYHLEASDGAIGHVSDFVMDDQDWRIRFLLVDTRNWLPGKKVVLPLHSIHKINWMDSSVYVDLPREAIEHSPEYKDGQLFSDEYAGQVDTHYRVGESAGPENRRGAPGTSSREYGRSIF